MMKYIAFNLLVLLTTQNIIAQKMNGSQIIGKVNDVFNPETSRAISRMTIKTTSGKERTFLFESFSKNKGEKNLVRYLEPGRVKGQAILMLNDADDIWVYFKRTKRVRKLATHAKKQKMEGSDFSYEDMGGGDAFIDEYKHRRLDDEEYEDQTCYVVELTRKEGSDQSYSKVVMWILKENFCPLKMEYYNEDNPGRLEKTLHQSDIRMINNIPVAMKAVMENLNDNTKTVMEIVETEFHIQLDDEMFTERSLKK